MKPTHGQCDQYMAEGQPCSGYRRLEADLAAARAELADMRIELDAARDNVEEWVKRYKAQSSKFNWDKSSDANPNNWR